MIKEKYNINVAFNSVSPLVQGKLAKKLYYSLKSLNSIIPRSLINMTGNMSIVFSPPLKGDVLTLGMCCPERNTIYLYGDNPQILAHEIFHAIDYQMAQELGITAKAYLSDYIFILSRSQDSEIRSLSNELSNIFTGHDVFGLAEIFEPLMKRSMKYDFTYEKKRYNCQPCEIMARIFETYVSSVVAEENLLFSRKNINHFHNSEENKMIDRFPTDKEINDWSNVLKDMLGFLSKPDIKKQIQYFADDIEIMDKCYEKGKYPLAVGGSPVHIKRITGRNRDGSFRYIKGDFDDLER